MTTNAPRSFNQHIFFDPKGVYYGTDDGYQDSSMGEFRAFEELYRAMPASRRENIHFVGAIGGLYSLNLMTCWRPSRITFFDINPHAVAYFRVIRRVFGESSDKEDFLDRLTDANFSVEDDAEAVIRENLALKQRGALGRDRASSYPRTLEQSWKYALDRFELTRRLLTEIPLETRVEGIESEGFAQLLRNSRNLWLYSSNIAEFTRSRLRFDHPGNCVVSAVIYPGQVDLLDLAPFGKRPVVVDCAIPMKAAAVDEVLIPEDDRPSSSDRLAQTLAEECQAAGLRPNGRMLDMGCGWGRLAVGLRAFLKDGSYEGIDSHRDHLKWAKQAIANEDPRFLFHIANLRNNYYNPQGTLDPALFRFPYADSGTDMVVMHGLSPYLQPTELENYLQETARVLDPAGKLLLSVYQLDATSRCQPHDFQFEHNSVAGTRPHREGLLAYGEKRLQTMLELAGLRMTEFKPGAWRGSKSGKLHEDLIVATPFC